MIVSKIKKNSVKNDHCRSKIQKSTKYKDLQDPKIQRSTRLKSKISDWRAISKIKEHKIQDLNIQRSKI